MNKTSKTLSLELPKMNSCNKPLDRDKYLITTWEVMKSSIKKGR